VKNDIYKVSTKSIAKLNSSISLCACNRMTAMEIFDQLPASEWFLSTLSLCLSKFITLLPFSIRRCRGLISILARLYVWLLSSLRTFGFHKLLG